MTTSTFFADTSDGEIDSQDNTYATAAAAGGTVNVDDTNDSHQCGQTNNGDSFTYQVWQYCIAWDTSALGSDTVSSATLSLVGTGGSGVDGSADVQFRVYDWGTSVTSADWRSAAQFSALTLCASIDVLNITDDDSTYDALTSEAAFASNINGSGFTRLIGATNRFAAGTTPTDERFGDFRSADATGTTQDPKLVVVHTPSGTTTPVSASATDTIAAAIVKLAGLHRSVSSSAADLIIRAIGKIELITAQAVASVTTAGVVLVALAATAQAVSSMTLRAGKILTASGAYSASIVKSIGKRLLAACSESALIVKLVGKIISAGSTILASLTFLRTFTLEVSITISASITRAVGKGLSSTSSLSSSVVNGVSLYLSTWLPAAVATITAIKVKLISLTATAAAAVATVGVQYFAFLADFIGGAGLGWIGKKRWAMRQPTWSPRKTLWRNRPGLGKKGPPK